MLSSVIKICLLTFDAQPTCASRMFPDFNFVFLICILLLKHEISRDTIGLHYIWSQYLAKQFELLYALFHVRVKTQNH